MSIENIRSFLREETRLAEEKTKKSSPQASLNHSTIIILTNFTFNECSKLFDELFSKDNRFHREIEIDKLKGKPWDLGERDAKEMLSTRAHKIIQERHLFDTYKKLARITKKYLKERYEAIKQSSKEFSEITQKVVDEGKARHAEGHNLVERAALSLAFIGFAPHITHLYQQKITELHSIKKEAHTHEGNLFETLEREIHKIEEFLNKEIDKRIPLSPWYDSGFPKGPKTHEFICPIGSHIQHFGFKMREINNKLFAKVQKIEIMLMKREILLKNPNLFVLDAATTNASSQVPFRSPLPKLPPPILTQEANPLPNESVPVTIVLDDVEPVATLKGVVPPATFLEKLDSPIENLFSDTISFDEANQDYSIPPPPPPPMGKEQRINQLRDKIESLRLEISNLDKEIEKISQEKRALRTNFSRLSKEYTTLENISKKESKFKAKQNVQRKIRAAQEEIILTEKEIETCQMAMAHIENALREKEIDKVTLLLKGIPLEVSRENAVSLLDELVVLIESLEEKLNSCLVTIDLLKEEEKEIDQEKLKDGLKSVGEFESQFSETRNDLANVIKDQETAFKEKEALEKERLPLILELRELQKNLENLIGKEKENDVEKSFSTKTDIKPGDAARAVKAAFLARLQEKPTVEALLESFLNRGLNA